MIQSREDNRVTVADGERAFARLGSSDKRLEWMNGAAHVITVDYGRERVFELLGDWMEAHHAQSAR
jgi:esterase/lipase